MIETPQEAFERGSAAGAVAARLGQHDDHFRKINGSMENVARELHSLTLAVQRLGDAAASDRATVLVTAKALKEAEAARRDKTEASWSPLQRLSLAVGVVGTAVATAIALYFSFRPN